MSVSSRRYNEKRMCRLCMWDRKCLTCVFVASLVLQGNMVQLRLLLRLNHSLNCHIYLSGLFYPILASDKLSN